MAARKEIDRSVILKLAAEAQLDVRTVRRAFEKGIDALKAEASRSRLREAAKKLGIKIM